jgi:UDP-glucose 4-epimerase
MKGSTTILVAGGAGYIGSHMVLQLCEAGCDVVVLDNLSTGHQDAVLGGKFIYGDLSDRPLLAALFRDHRFDVVMHFASSIEVGESVENPAKYYHNNVVNTLTLLDVMVEAGVKRIVFSSSAAVYGNPLYLPIDEKHPVSPVNPYGRTKAMIESVLSDYDRAYGLRSVALRYFNAAGADPHGRLGERHEPETHLIPRVLRAISHSGKRLTINGRDYETPDGTCVRDYVHVSDICQAHMQSMNWLISGGESAVFNIGNGSGYSILEVVEAARLVTDCSIDVEFGARRPGDPAILVADSTQIRSVLGWQPRYEDLESICSTAYQWERQLQGLPRLTGNGIS